MRFFLRNYKMNAKIHYFSIRLCIRSDHAGPVANFHIHGFELEEALVIPNVRYDERNSFPIYFTKYWPHEPSSSEGSEFLKSEIFNFFTKSFIFENLSKFYVQLCTYSGIW